MSGPKHTLKLQSKSPRRSPSPPQKTSSGEFEKNAELVLEVQKLRQNNGKLVNRVIELSRKHHEAAADNIRLREIFRRIGGCLEKFVPCMVTGTQYLDIIATELEKASVSQNDTVESSPVSNDDGMEDSNYGGSIPVSPLRTGIARPIVQGHTICKPSISLQRVIPRQTTTHYVPVPVRSLNLAELVRGDEQSRPLNAVTEEEDEHSTEEDEDTEDTTQENLSHSRSTSEENPSPTNENGSVVLSVEDESAVRLSVIVEQSVMLSPVIEEQSPTSRAVVSTQSPKRNRNRSDVISEEEHVESSDDEAVELSLIEARCKLMNPDRRKELKEGTSKDYDARGNFSPNSRRRRKRQQEKEVSPARDENETSALRRSVNGLLNSIKKSRISSSSSSRNKRLSDAENSPSTGRVNGFDTEKIATNPRVSLTRISSSAQPTSSENDSFDGDVPIVPPSLEIMVTKRKRGSCVTTRNKRSRQPSPPIEDVLETPPPTTVTEPPRRAGKTSRRSWTELVRKRSRSLEEAGDIETEAKENSSRREVASNNSFVDDLPTIVITRCSGSLIARNSCTESPNNNLDDSNSSSDVPLSQRSQTAAPEIMVTKRKRGSCGTTRNKRSRQPSPPIEDVRETLPPTTVTEPPRRAGKTSRRSWTELVRKRSRSLEEAGDIETGSKENSPRREVASHNAFVDDLPTILISRCSGSFVARSSCRESLSNILDDSNSSSDVPLSRLMPAAVPENMFYNKNVPTTESGCKGTKAKPRRKAKPRSKPATKLNAKQSQEKRSSIRSMNGVGHESQNSLNPSLLNSSVASSVSDKDHSVDFNGPGSATGRPRRRATAPINLKEKPLNVKLRRN